MNATNNVLLLAGVILLEGCTTPAGYTEKPLHQFDRNTTYRIDDSDTGFAVTVYYSRYQFVPESDVVAQAGKSALLSIAHTVAEARGHRLEAIDEQRIRMSMGRNGLTGVTSWSGTLEVRYEQKQGQPPAPPLARVSGSGFFISRTGHLITCAHVVEGSKEVSVRTRAGTKSARILGVDGANDLSLLKIEADTDALPIAPSRGVKPGQAVATVGFPNIALQGLAPKVSRGVVASLSGIQDDPKQFQVSLPVQPGNSGGPLVDLRGNVVGVIAAKLASSPALAASGVLPENVNYATKSGFLLGFLEAYPDVAAALEEPVRAESRFEDLMAHVEKATVLVVVQR